MHEPAITINGKPIHLMSDADILEQLAREAEAELTEKEKKAIDKATD